MDKLYTNDSAKAVNKKEEEVDFSDLDLHAEENKLTVKIALKEFVMATLATEDTTSHTFTLHVQTKKDVHSFIHCMRVELSRQRRRLLKQNRKPKKFSIWLQEILRDKEKQYCWHITLSTVSLHKKDDGMDDILDFLSLD